MKIVLTPDWFIGKDVITEFFSFLVLLIFFILSSRIYKLNKKNKAPFYLGIGFCFVALAQLASIITKLVLYYDIGPSEKIGRVIITSGLLDSVDIFYYIGFFLHRFLTLVGLYIIYKIPRKKRSFGDYALVTYFLLLSALLSTKFYYLFYLTSFFLLIYIARDYYKIYKNNKFSNTKMLLIAFIVLALAQIIYILSKKDLFFAIANSIELMGYLILLVVAIKILEYGGKKTKSDGNNIRYVGGHSRKT